MGPEGGGDATCALLPCPAALALAAPLTPCRQPPTSAFTTTAAGAASVLPASCPASTASSTRSAALLQPERGGGTAGWGGGGCVAVHALAVCVGVQPRQGRHARRLPRRAAAHLQSRFRSPGVVGGGLSLGAVAGGGAGRHLGSGVCLLLNGGRLGLSVGLLHHTALRWGASRDTRTILAGWRA